MPTPTNQNMEMKTPYAQQGIDAQLSSIEPLIEAIYQNQAKHVLQKGLDIILEYFYYVLAIALFIFPFVMNTVFPFYVLGEIMQNEVYRQTLGNKGDFDMFNIAVKGLVVMIGWLFLVLGYHKRKDRRYRNLLQQTGKVLKSLEVYFMSRKEELEKQE